MAENDFQMVSPRLDSLPRMRPKCRNVDSLGQTYICRPHLAPDNLAEELPWSWFPWNLKVGVIMILQIAAVLGTLIVYAVTIAGFTKTRGIIAAIVSVFDVIIGFLIYVISWNYQLREVLCFAHGKKIQAEETWKKYLDENGEKDRAKEVFHEEGFRSIMIYVLKDGTIEFRNKGAELNTNLGASLGLNFTAEDKAAKQSERKEYVV